MFITAPSTRYIHSTEAAKLIRTQLKKSFPSQKFSVRTDHNAINIKWNGGPLGSQVEEVTNGYKGGGFDGMIDCAYSKNSWLYPDGSSSFASCDGTTGSVPADYDLPLKAGAELVQFACKYIFLSRIAPKHEAEQLCEFLNSYVSDEDKGFAVVGSDEYGWHVRHDDYNIERRWWYMRDPLNNQSLIPDYAWSVIARIYNLK